MKEKDLDQLVNSILSNVGGKDNLARVTHCVTRLRIEVKDRGIVKEKDLKNLKGTMGYQWANGQLQIIIGASIEQVYTKFCEVAMLDICKPVQDDSEKKKSIFDKVIQSIVGCVSPTVGVMIATGLIKGLLSLCVVLKWVDNTSGTYVILQALADSLFYFFPVIVGFNAGKVFNCNPVITAIIGCTLIYPSLITAYTEGSALTFLGIPVILKSYTSSVLPVIFASWISSEIEKLVSKYTPDILKLLVVPFVTLIVIVPLTLLAVGPCIDMLSTMLSNAVLWVLNSLPVLAGVVFGGVWQIITMLGLHYGIGPVTMQLFLDQGYDVTAAGVTASMFALVGVCLAVFLRTRNQNLKSASLSAGVTALMGVTEPAIYSVALPYKKAFLSAIIGGTVSGIFLMMTNVVTYGGGINGILQLSVTISESGFGNTVFWCIGQLIAFGVSFALAYILIGKDMRKENEI